MTDENLNPNAEAAHGSSAASPTPADDTTELVDSATPAEAPVDNSGAVLDEPATGLTGKKIGRWSLVLGHWPTQS